METQKNKQRLKVISKIKKYEKLGGDFFNKDVENDPPNPTLQAKKVDFLHKRPINKIKNIIANIIVNKQKKLMTKKLNIKIEGEENLANIDGGAIITSNHFSHYDSIPVMNVVEKINKNKKLFIMVKEGNYFVKGKLGFILKHSNTLPTSSNTEVMKGLNKAISTIVKNGDFVLIYPEQAMWWNYRKPRPHKLGAYHYACKNNVPIIPCFVTMSDSKEIDEYGFLQQNYTIHIMPPLYPEKDKNLKTNSQEMCQKAYELTKNKYEEVYKQKLDYKK